MGNANGGLANKSSDAQSREPASAFLTLRGRRHYPALPSKEAAANGRHLPPLKPETPEPCQSPSLSGDSGSASGSPAPTHRRGRAAELRGTEGFMMINGGSTAMDIPNGHRRQAWEPAAGFNALDSPSVRLSASPKFGVALAPETALHRPRRAAYNRDFENLVALVCDVKRSAQHLERLSLRFVRTLDPKRDFFESLPKLEEIEAGLKALAVLQDHVKQLARRYVEQIDPNLLESDAGILQVLSAVVNIITGVDSAALLAKPIGTLIHDCKRAESTTVKNVLHRGLIQKLTEMHRIAANLSVSINIDSDLLYEVNVKR